jgi:hypothetical protein
MPGRIAAAGATPTQRAALFYGVCIWVRVGLAVGVYFAAEWELEGTMIAVIVASSAVTVVELALAAVASLFTAAVPAVVLFLLADVGWGVAHSLVARPFKNGSL